jgi:hypothetical protein
MLVLHPHAAVSLAQSLGAAADAARSTDCDRGGVMRRRAGIAGCVIVGVLCASVPCTAGESRENAALFSVTGGLGNAVGGLGVQGERYWRDGRLSVFVGVGYVPGSDEEPNLPTGLAAAAGCRTFFGGRKHRVFVEGSVSQVAGEWWVEANGSLEQARRYGPGVQVGYQLITGRGLTLASSVGVGYAVGAKYDKTYLLAGLAIGYTRRRP